MNDITDNDITEAGTETATPSTTDPKITSHVLIEGLFDGRDAQEVLLTLLNFKIDHHRRRTFSSMERFGKPDATSERRIKELEATKAQVQASLAEATDADTPIRIHSTIQLTVGAGVVQTAG